MNRNRDESKSDLRRAFKAHNAVARFGDDVLTKAEHAVLRTIALRINGNDTCTAGRESLARDSRVAPDTVSRCISSLVDKTFIEVEYGKSAKGNIYYASIKLVWSGPCDQPKFGVGDKAAKAPPANENRRRSSKGPTDATSVTPPWVTDATSSTPTDATSSITTEKTSSTTDQNGELEPQDGDTVAGVPKPGEISDKNSGKIEDPENVKKRAFELAESYYKACLTSPKARVALFTELKRLRWPHLPTCKPDYHYNPFDLAALNETLSGSEKNVHMACHVLAHLFATWDPKPDGEYYPALKYMYPTPPTVLGQHFEDAVIRWGCDVKAGEWELPDAMWAVPLMTHPKYKSPSAHVV